MQTAGSLSEGQLEDRWAGITSHLKSPLTLPAMRVNTSISPVGGYMARPVLQLPINFTPVNRPCCSRCWTTKPYGSSCWISRSIFKWKHPKRDAQPLSTPGTLYLHSSALAITAGKRSCCMAHAKIKRGKDQVHTNISFLSSLDFIFPV